MYYHIILTERCNSQCKYCYEKSMQEFENGLEKKWDYDDKIPFDSEVSVDKLKKFLKSGDTLIFYGGEPLVNFSKMKEILDGFEKSDIRFCMQTNGKLLDKIPFEYIKRLDKMLVSIDGDKERTDSNRGIGTHDLVLKNLKCLRDKGYSGEIVARMVVSNFHSDIFEQIKYILDLGIFDSVHWQIDAGFYKNDFDFIKFSKFVEEYNKSVSDLIDFWIETMIKEKKVLRLYPFLGIFDNLYYNKKSKLQCGSGYANFSINTKGDLSACPIMNSVKNFYCGSVEKGVEKEIHCEGFECKNCDVFDICGGRCLYSHYAKLWPKEGEELVCKTIICLINSLKEKLSEIKNLISEGIVLENDFEFEKYFGPEIIP